ncbi:unnamed protein product [Pieris macdunnoughi]|uniref:Uncharacterized protein n=1 Tax=Pieris macdunnoughi TaxID=345717 RepID=A0A821Q899_9NEOP|nr:unnamed protein product [Pieris macdunnoughi]
MCDLLNGYFDVYMFINDSERVDTGRHKRITHFGGVVVYSARLPFEWQITVTRSVAVVLPLLAAAREPLLAARFGAPCIGCSEAVARTSSGSPRRAGAHNRVLGQRALISR